MKVIYEGHSCFSLESDVRVVIDPFFTGNDLAKKDWQDVKADIILITHGHSDHIGDAVAIAENNDAIIVGAVELIRHLESGSVKTIAINQGGSIEIDGVNIKMVPAIHGSQIENSQGCFYAGLAAGYIIKLDGKTFYHAGDTALFGDMLTVIGRQNLDIAFLPIGDYYTMGPEDAVIAAHWLEADVVIPMHYNTFPVIKQDVAAFALEVDNKTDSICKIMNPGEIWCLDE